MGALAEVAFDADPGSEYGFVSPAGVPIAPDGFGNFWIADVDPVSGKWGTVLFVCHDPPVVVVQAPSLEVFVGQLLERARSGPGGAIDEVHEDASYRVWKENPGLLSVEDARSSEDPDLRAFADELGDGFDLCDLRGASIGDGFSWGRAGPNSKVRRYGSALLFAVQRKVAQPEAVEPKKRSLLSRLFGKRG